MLRLQAKEKLQKLSLDIRFTSSQKIATKIIASKIFTQSKNIACYIPIEHEINIWKIIKIIWQQNKNCYLPALDSNKKYYLQFVKFQKQDKLIKTKYKILEPKIILNKIIAPQDLDLVIIPLLGFNNNLFRLGRGAGCYDRTFEFKKQDHQKNPHLLGIGYNLQHIEFEPKPWDVAMNEIISV